MKKIIIILSTIFVFAACNTKPKTVAVDSKIKPVTTIKFQKDIYDFGEITVGEKVSYAFEFKNTGNLPLIITNAVASCGCTVPNWPKEPIGAGETGKINVVFNSIGKKGLQDKVITLTANTNPAQTKLHLIGEILKKNNCCD